MSNNKREKFLMIHSNYSVYQIPLDIVTKYLVDHFFDEVRGTFGGDANNTKEDFDKLLKCDDFEEVLFEIIGLGILDFNYFKEHLIKMYDKPQEKEEEYFWHDKLEIL